MPKEVNFPTISGRTGITSRVLNFLWINLDLPAAADPADGSIRQPLPEKYIDNVRASGAAHPDTQVVLWVDSRRLTERQYAFLQEALEQGTSNVHLKDLRGIPAYDHEHLYNLGEKNPDWRSTGQTALIWRQVDAAKILISLQGDFDQYFFADLDHAHLEVNSPAVQGRLEKRGVMIGASSDISLGVENQLWGFTRAERGFFEDYYTAALRCAYNGKNAWRELEARVEKLYRKKGAPRIDICMPINGDGSSAEHPGHEWRSGHGADGKPVVVEKGALSSTFKETSERTPCPALDVLWTPPPGTCCQPAPLRILNRVIDGLKPPKHLV